MAQNDVSLEGLSDMLNDLDSLYLTTADKVKATSAGADAYIEHLIPKIPENEDKKHGKHLKDMVTYRPGQYLDGSTDVGFTKKGYYARFLNNGTKKMKKYPGGLHFMEHAADEAKRDVNEAIKKSLLGGGK